MKLPVRHCHHPGQNKSNGSGSKAKHDSYTAEKLEYPADTRLRQEGRRTGLARYPPKPTEQDQPTGLNE
jgi:hypothetical protein